jgi:hemoglobin-like flavoprotein
MSTALTISDSADAILTARDSFGELFYTRLFDRHPELQTWFAEADMGTQASMLTVAMTLIAKYYVQPNVAIHQYLQVLGSRHSARQIPRDSFPDFFATILDALRAFHADAWSEELESQWQEAGEQAMQAILEGYDMRFHV